MPQLVAQNHSSIVLDTASKGWIGQFVKFWIDFFLFFFGWKLNLLFLIFSSRFWVLNFALTHIKNTFSEPWLRNDCLGGDYFRPAPGITSDVKDERLGWVRFRAQREGVFNFGTDQVRVSEKNFGFGYGSGLGICNLFLINRVLSWSGIFRLHL